MPRTGEDAFPLKRLEELAGRALRMERACFSPFLTPPEAEWAGAAARKQGAVACLFGGYEDAERQMARFAASEDEAAAFPIQALEIRWPRQSPPTHRDLLGSAMGLGIKRQCLGDIVLLADRAYLFADGSVAGHLAANLSRAGRTNLRVEPAEGLPAFEESAGEEVRDTVASLRLDALVASGLNLSREKAAALILSGRVKLRHMLTLRADARVAQGDTVSIRGMGRLRLTEAGGPTRKGRLPVTITRFGIR